MTEPPPQQAPVPAPTLDYGLPPRALPPARPGDYVIATVGGLFVAGASFALLAFTLFPIVAWIAFGPTRSPTRGATAVAVGVGAAVLALVAGASSFRSTVRRYRRARSDVRTHGGAVGVGAFRASGSNSTLGPSP